MYFLHISKGVPNADHVSESDSRFGAVPGVCYTICPSNLPRASEPSPPTRPPSQRLWWGAGVIDTCELSSIDTCVLSSPRTPPLCFLCVYCVTLDLPGMSLPAKFPLRKTSILTQTMRRRYSVFEASTVCYIPAITLNICKYPTLIVRKAQNRHRHYGDPTFLLDKHD